MSKPLSESEKLITEKSLLHFPDMLFEQTSPEDFYKPFADFFREKLQLSIYPSVDQQQVEYTGVLAKEAHKTQERRFINPHTGKPYGYEIHLMGVAEDALITILSKLNTGHINCPPGLMQIVAYLHDIIEDRKDTKMTVNNLRKKLKDEVGLDDRVIQIVIEAVLFLTKPDVELPEGVTDKKKMNPEQELEYAEKTKERDKAYYENLATAPFWVKVIKLADNLHNLSTIEGQGNSEKALKNIIKIRKSWEIIFSPEEQQILSKDDIIPSDLEERTRALETVYTVLYTKETVSEQASQVFLDYTRERVRKFRSMGNSKVEESIPSEEQVVDALKTPYSQESKEVINSIWQFFTTSYETIHPALVNAEGAKGLQRLWQKEYLEEMSDYEFYTLFNKTFLRFTNEEGEIDYAKTFEVLKILHLSTLSTDSGEKNVLSRAHQNNNPQYILLQQFFMRTKIYGKYFLRLDSENTQDMKCFQDLLESVDGSKRTETLEIVTKRTELPAYERNLEKWYFVIEEANTLLQEAVMNQDMEESQRAENRAKALLLILQDAVDIEKDLTREFTGFDKGTINMFPSWKNQLLEPFPFVVNMLEMLGRKK